MSSAGSSTEPLLGSTCTGHPLVRFLRAPASSEDFSVSDWERVLVAARKGQLLSRLAWIAIDRGLLEQLPPKVRFHFHSALRVAETQSISVHWEVHQIRRVLAAQGIPFVLLKGAAYVAGGLAARHGRLMSDVDILVRQSQLLDTEKALCSHGWFPTKLDAYDQRYYRQWMHELPPLQHLDRGTSLDVHHTILPPTALLKPDVDRLWQDAQPVAGRPGVFVLSPADMVLHSATHLFHEGELEHGLRDLVDMDALLGEFSSNPDFYRSLCDRAEALDLTRPLHYALRYCQAYLQTAVPGDVLDRMQHHASRSRAVRSLMDAIVTRSINTILDQHQGIATQTAAFAMYVRSHYLRMPLRLLVPHLLRKQFKGDKSDRPL